MTSTSDSDVRRLVREVIMEVLPELQTAQIREIAIHNDSDLAAFVDEVFRVAQDAHAFERYRSGALRFAWVPDVGSAVPAPVHLSNASVEVSPTTQPSLRIDKGAVTERIVAQAAAQGAGIVLGRAAVVTPLGREFARRNNVILERAE